MAKGPGTAAKRYNKLEKDRTPFLVRARDCSKLTIPTLIPPEGKTSNQNLPTPYQSLGARGVNNLSSKLLLTMLPPNAPFFQFQADPKIVDELSRQNEGAKTAIKEALAKIERQIMDKIDASNIRVSTFEALKHLLVGGNVAIYISTDGGMRVFPLEEFVCKRDPEGTLLETIIKEQVSQSILDDDTLRACQIEKTSGSNQKSDNKSLDLYTRIIRKGERYEVNQELNGYVVPESESKYPIEKSPYIILRWAKIDGEDYGRGFVEEYLGDLISLEGLYKAIVMGSAAAAKVLFFVRPNSTTKHKDVVEAESGDVKTGHADDVSVLQMQKYNDFKTAFETVGRLEQRLSFAFLLNSAIQRKGERVTAQEIRYMAGELEDALGGAYSLLAQEFQLPLLNTLKNQMQKARMLPALPDKRINIKIVTGMQALGRKHDQNKLDELLQHLAPLGPETLQMYLKIGDYIKRTGANLGVDLEGLVRSEEEVSEMQNQGRMQEMIKQFGPEVIKQAGPVVQDQIKTAQGGRNAQGKE